MNAVAKKSLSSLGYALEANYYAALLVSLVAAIMVVTGNQSFLDTGSDAYNPLLNNLKLMLVYLILAELSVFVYCFLKQSYGYLTLAGLFLLLMSGALEFYGQVNQLVIDQKFHVFFLYTGLSHLFYGVLSSLPEINENGG
ncbi:MAG: hypothetical protein ACU85E_06810 [Gammaproteobacteria bacterium]